MHITPGTGSRLDLPGLVEEGRSKWISLERWWIELQREKEHKRAMRSGVLAADTQYDTTLTNERAERGAAIGDHTLNTESKPDPTINVFRSHEVGASFERILKYNAKKFCRAKGGRQQKGQGELSEAWSELRSLKTDRMAQSKQ